MARWNQGEHVVLIGMNGSGKTTLARHLLTRYRKWKIMLVTKPDDITWPGWRTVKDHKAINGRTDSYRLHPEYESSRQQFKEVMDRVWKEGGWCIYLDELYHLEHKGLSNDVIKLLTQGRSKRITVVGGVQRPAWVTRFALSEPRHTFAFRVGDNRDAKAIGDGLGKAFQTEVERLRRYEFAYHDKVTGEIKRGNSRDIEGIFDD
jgi:tRNA A37 threonylcarbamoyladenosine biosynthesis protein TsaE